MPAATVDRKRFINIKAVLKGKPIYPYTLDLIKYCNLEPVNWYTWRDGANNTLNIDLKKKDIFINIKNKLEAPDLYYKNTLDFVIDKSDFCIITRSYLFLFQISDNIYMRCYDTKYIHPLSLKKELLDVVFKIIKQHLDNKPQEELIYNGRKIITSSLPTADEQINKKLKEIVNAQR